MKGIKNVIYVCIRSKKKVWGMQYEIRDDDDGWHCFICIYLFHFILFHFNNKHFSSPFYFFLVGVVIAAPYRICFYNSNSSSNKTGNERLRHKNLLSKSTSPFKMWTHFVLILPSHSEFTTYSVMLMIFYILCVSM